MQELGKTFKEIYEGLPRGREVAVVSQRGEFIKRIALATKKGEATVRGWLSKGIVPDALTQEVISKELGVDAKTLFPA